MTNLIKEAEEWLNAEEHEQLLAETGAGKPYTETIEKELIEKLTEALKRQQEMLDSEELEVAVQHAIDGADFDDGARKAIKVIKKKLNDN
tara:strand:- start:356 stop:625 length:270 start_codon:yes stop_codon:yes gene_type:complete